MNPRIHIWNGWDVVAVIWLIIGLVPLALIPSAIITLTGEAQTVALILLLCSGVLFLLAAFGRRIRHLSGEHENPRPYDAPD